jgi:adenylate kinase
MQHLFLISCALLLSLFSSNSLLASTSGETLPVIVILLGPPGSGRDALAVKLSNSFSLPYISCADLLLDYCDDESARGKEIRECLHAGLTISDELMLRLIAERVKSLDCVNGFLLDGFPRSFEQAKALSLQFKETHSFFPAYIRASDEWLISHHKGRLVCTRCGRVYHIDQSPPQNTALCDFCGSSLTQRYADSQESIKRQCENYRFSSLPIITFYSEEGSLVEVNGNRVFDEILQEIKNLIAAERAAFQEPKTIWDSSVHKQSELID